MVQDAGRVLQEQPDLGKLITSALAQYETSGKLLHISYAQVHTCDGLNARKSMAHELVMSCDVQLGQLMCPVHKPILFFSQPLSASLMPFCPRHDIWSQPH